MIKELLTGRAENLIVMHHIRITKYDPQFRDEQGGYLRDEWIGAGQIGDAFVDGLSLGCGEDANASERKRQPCFAARCAAPWVLPML